MIGSLTTREAESVASEARDLVQSRDLVSLAVTGLSAAGGVVVAQEIADRVLAAANLNKNPQNIKDYAAAVGTKGAVAVGFGVLASSLSGLGLVASGFMAVGALASAGADLLEGLLTTAPVGGSAPLDGRVGDHQAQIEPRTPQNQPEATAATDGGYDNTSAATGGY